MTDREQIEDLMIRYGRSNDTRDPELLRTCVTDDIVALYEPFVGPVRGWENFVASWLAGIAPLGGTHHFSNFTFDVDGDVGAYTCLVFAAHWPRDAALSTDMPLFLTGARYENDVRRTDDGWRITHIHLMTQWMTGDAGVVGHFRGTDAA